MILLTVVSFSNMDMSTARGLDFKGLFIISLVFIFPLLFLIQGILSSINNMTLANIVISFALSIFSYLILMKIYLNNSAFVYIILYPALWILGYSITYILKVIHSAISK